jgi:hypothetical protein
MAQIGEAQSRIIHIGGEAIELQEWKVERLADDTFEYHSYCGHNYSKSGMLNNTKGAMFMIMRLTDPGSILETMEYRIGRTGLPGSGNDLLQTEWDNRGSLAFYRWDQVLQIFYAGGTV